MPAYFDPEVIQEFANRLYKRASSITVLYGTLGFLIGIVGAAPLFGTRGLSFLGVPVLMLTTSVAALIGRERGYNMRLVAQQALCQLRIELNTRPRQ